MSAPVSTHSTPAGCLVGFFSLISLAIAVLGLYGLYGWTELPLQKCHYDREFWQLVAISGAGLVGFTGLSYLARRILRSTDYRGYNAMDPREPRIKF